MASWRPGDLAIYVDDRPAHNTPPALAANLHLLEIGKRYWVMDVTRSGGLILAGPRAPNRSGAWWAWRFRKYEPVCADATVKGAIDA